MIQLRLHNLLLKCDYFFKQQLLDIWARESVAIDELKGDPCPKLPKSTILSKIRWVTLGILLLLDTNVIRSHQ
jgi:hypothetical protein